MPDFDWINSLCLGCMREKHKPGACPLCGFDPEAYESLPHYLRPLSVLSGKYLVGRVLGQGGFGITYIGLDLNLKIRIAIKEYFPSGFVTRENTSANTVLPFAGEKKDFFTKGRDSFVYEAQSLARFYNLPGIVSVRDYFQENGTAYIVMEYLDGQTLKSHIAQNGKLPWDAAVELFRPVITSLMTIHESGLIHRDISPDNIMITRDGTPKLLDFGAARIYDASGNQSLSIMLKPGFSPEEQYRARGKQGPWTDVYALCATLYNIITGTRLEAANDRLIQDELRLPSELGVSIPPAQESILMRGLAVRYSERIQSMEELAGGLYDKKPPLPESPAPKQLAPAHQPDSSVLVKPPIPKPLSSTSKPDPQMIEGDHRDRPQLSARLNRMLVFGLGGLALVLVVLLAINLKPGTGVNGKPINTNPAASSTPTVQTTAGPSFKPTAVPEVTAIPSPKATTVPTPTVIPSATPVPVASDYFLYKADSWNTYLDDVPLIPVSLYNISNQTLSHIALVFYCEDFDGKRHMPKGSNDFYIYYTIDKMCGPSKWCTDDVLMEGLDITAVYSVYCAITQFETADGQTITIPEDKWDYWKQPLRLLKFVTPAPTDKPSMVSTPKPTVTAVPKTKTTPTYVPTDTPAPTPTPVPTAKPTPLADAYLKATGTCRNYYEGRAPKVAAQYTNVSGENIDGFTLVYYCADSANRMIIPEGKTDAYFYSTTNRVVAPGANVYSDNELLNGCSGVKYVFYAVSQIHTAAGRTVDIPPSQWAFASATYKADYLARTSNSRLRYENGSPKVAAEYINVSSQTLDSFTVVYYCKDEARDKIMPDGQNDYYIYRTFNKTITPWETYYVDDVTMTGCKNVKYVYFAVTQVRTLTGQTIDIPEDKRDYWVFTCAVPAPTDTPQPTAVLTPSPTPSPTPSNYLDVVSDEWSGFLGNDTGVNMLLINKSDQTLDRFDLVFYCVDTNGEKIMPEGQKNFYFHYTSSGPVMPGAKFTIERFPMKGCGKNVESIFWSVAQLYTASGQKIIIPKDKWEFHQLSYSFIDANDPDVPGCVDPSYYDTLPPIQSTVDSIITIVLYSEGSIKDGYLNLSYKVTNKGDRAVDSFNVDYAVVEPGGSTPAGRRTYNVPIQPGECVFIDERLEGFEAPIDFLGVTLVEVHTTDNETIVIPENELDMKLLVVH